MAKVLFSLPSIKEGQLDNAETIKKILSYLYQLNEQLRYQLTHIDDENISQEGISVESLSADVQKVIKDGQNTASVTVTADYLKAQLKKTIDETESMIATISATVDTINLAVTHNRVGDDGVGEVHNSAIDMDAEGITLRAGTITLEAGSALTMKTQNDDDATVNGGRIWHGRNMVLSTAEPVNPTTGMVWIQPDDSTTLTGTWSSSGLTSRPWQKEVDVHITGTALGNSSSTCRYTVSIPIYHSDRNKEGYSVTAWLLPENYGSTDEGINLGTKSMSASGYYTADVTSTQWLGNAAELVLHVMVSHPSYITVDRDKAVSMLAVSEGSGGASGWKSCSVHWYAGD